MNTHRLLIAPISLCLAVALQAKDSPPPEVRPWPAKADPAGFTVVQTEADHDIKTVAITSKETGEKLTFTAEGRMYAPTVLAPHNGWPQIELICDGPPELLWKKLYRMENGAYRCARIDEFARTPLLAPKNAPVVDDMRLLRSRDTKEGDAESFEEFTTETPSPDGKTSIRFNYLPKWLSTVEIVSDPAKDAAQKIYDVEDGGSLGSLSFALWRPDSGAFALFMTDGPRWHTTKIFAKKGDAWNAVELPKVKLPLEKGWDVRKQFVKPLRWTDARTLVLLYSGDYYYGDREPGSYYFNVTLNWGKDGKARVASVKEVPEPKEES